jgi:hypothetical protein
VLNLLKN